MTHPYDPAYQNPVDPAVQPDPGYGVNPTAPASGYPGGDPGFQSSDNANKSPEQIREEIEQTRRNLGYDVDAMAEKVSPSKVAERQKNKIADKLSSWKDSIMGTADDAGSELQHRGQQAQAKGHQLADSARGTAQDAAGSVRDAAGTARDAVQQMPQQIKQGTRGNPLAVGMIALGAGWLIGSLIPASQKEQELAVQAKDAAQPMMQEAQQVAKDMGQNLQEPAQEAVQSVRDQAQSSAETVKSDAQGETERLKSEAQSSGENVRDAGQ
ncbi:DUF3618 domain-containing protein [Brevibacterium daeguense]|uniref:DUF3618 domain-containing protein n=1 Tax=Brevibacterium daeguense TaxID=909936 RepID=A0ABP8EKG9_9MICO|nr:DUF3618 domain-containing protein [Brevibacterium daeguense]